MASLVTHLWELLFGKSELRRSRRRRSVKAGIELLEDRTLLSTYTWDGTILWAGGELASNPNNWSGPGLIKTVPGVSDTIVFSDADTAPCTIDAAFGGTVKVLNIYATYNSTVTLNRDLEVTANAQIQGDKLDGSGNLLIGDSPPVGPPQFAATLLWNGGALAGAVGSNVTINSSSTANIIGNAGPGLTLIGRSLVNYGTVNWNTISNLFLQASANLDNYGVMNVNTTTTVAINSSHTDAPVPSFIIEEGGQLNLNIPTNGAEPPGSGELDVDCRLTNRGTISINQGSIHALFGSVNQGMVHIQDGASYSLFGSGHLFSGGLGPNTSVIDGGGWLVFNSGATVGIDQTVSVTNVDDSADLVNHTANSTLLVYGTYYWRVGKWGGAGQTSIAHGANLILAGNGTGAYALESMLANHGTVTWQKAADINVANGGSIVNDLYGVFDIQNNQTISKGAGAGTFINAGTLQKSQGTGVARINIKYIPIGLGAWTKELGFGTIEFALFVTLNNNVEVDPGGTVAFAGGVEHDGGTVANNGGTIKVIGDYVLKAGTFTMMAGSLIADNFNIGAGALFSGFGNITANVINAGTLTIQGSGGAGQLSINADSSAGVQGLFEQTATGVLNLRILGAGLNDWLSAVGNNPSSANVTETLNGTVNVLNPNNYSPVVGDTFALLDGVSLGQFAT
ncbi:MAG TPA: hypothetical protein DDY78_13330, partial [Planctomycetales bacterium]|nr:hypothetical protein [Planctomycetales bacterium]